MSVIIISPKHLGDFVLSVQSDPRFQGVDNLETVKCYVALSMCVDAITLVNPWNDNDPTRTVISHEARVILSQRLDYLGLNPDMIDCFLNAYHKICGDNASWLDAIYDIMHLSGLLAESKLNLL